MRHYYRFMELEPVMEQEEDSAGDASPASSLGSPSFSPPPDDWAQLSGKEFHDSLSNHLLQEHLELQRAYRMLEVQYRNSDTRSSRDVERLKEVLASQERLREELQRAKERETTLRGEMQDLQEQNELLEFRILELEECQENASARCINTETREASTETDLPDCADTLNQATCTNAPFSTPAEVNATSATVDQRQADTLATGHEDASKNDDTLARLLDADSHQPKHRQTQTNQCATELCHQRQNSCHISSSPSSSEITKDSPRSPSTRQEDTDNTSLRESISCTLCRRLPRRRSFPGTSHLSLIGLTASDDHKPTADGDCLRKSKSDGAIKVKHCFDGQKLCSLKAKYESQHALTKGEGKISPVTFKVLSSNNESLEKKRLGSDILEGGKTSTKSFKHASVQWDLGNERVSANLVNSRVVDDQVKTMRSMLSAIYNVLRETREEVECTNSELREEVQTLESTLQRLTEDAKKSGEASGAVVDSTPMKLPPLVRRSRSLSFSKECYCCSQELRPSLEEVIAKIQQLMDLVVEKETFPTEVSLDNSQEWSQSNETKPHEEVDAVTRKPYTCTTEISNPTVDFNQHLPKIVTEDDRSRMNTVQNLDGENQNISIVSTEVDPNETLSEILPLKSPSNNAIAVNIKSQQDTCCRGQPQNVANLDGNAYEHFSTKEMNCEKITYADQMLVPEVYTYNDVEVSSVRDMSTRPAEAIDNLVYGLENSEMHEMMITSPELKPKPVLRRWREQLIVRRDRVQPWRIELLDFPKRQPSVV